MSLEKALGRAEQRRRLPSPEKRREIRERAGVTQLDVARAVSVSRAAVSLWEKGARTPKAGGSLKRYLDVLDQLTEAAQ